MLTGRKVLHLRRCQEELVRPVSVGVGVDRNTVLHVEREFRPERATEPRVLPEVGVCSGMASESTAAQINEQQGLTLPNPDSVLRASKP